MTDGTAASVAVISAVESTSVAPALGDLFDDYRLFYKRQSDRSTARHFIETLIHAGTSRLFVAELEARLVGFVHLVPYIDSLAMTKAWILEDFYVTPSTRKRGVGSALLEHVLDYAQRDGATRITLTTAHDNYTAQRLYEAHGFIMDRHFRVYENTLVVTR